VTREQFVGQSEELARLIYNAEFMYATQYTGEPIPAWDLLSNRQKSLKIRAADSLLRDGRLQLHRKRASDATQQEGPEDQGGDAPPVRDA
jgi:hypothetical protein